MQLANNNENLPLCEKYLTNYFAQTMIQKKHYDILKNCKPSCNIYGYTGKIRKLHSDFLHKKKNSVKSISIHYSLQSAILTMEQEYYVHNLIEIFGLIGGYVALFFGILSKIINFIVQWTVKYFLTKKYDNNSVEVFPDRMLVKNHPIELPVGDILHCNGELGISLAPAEGKYFTWCDPLYLVVQLKSEKSSLSNRSESFHCFTHYKI